MLIRLILIGCSVLVAGGGGYYCMQFLWLPHPSKATPSQLGYWLVLRDMEEQSEEIRLALVERLIEDPTVFSTSGDSSVELSDSQEEQLRKNINALKYSWFQDRVRQFHDTEIADRWEFLESQIDVVSSWATLMLENAEILYPDAPQDQDFSALFFDEVEGWLADTPPENHPKAYAAVAEGIVCWLGTSSLTDQPDSARLELASRVVREMELGVEIGGSFGSVPEKAHDMLGANCELLVEAWLLDTAINYGAINSGKERGRFVDGLIAKVEKWKVLELLGNVGGVEGTKTNSATKMSESLAKLNEMVEKWIARAEPEAGKSLKKMMSSVKAKMLFRFLQSGG